MLNKQRMKARAALCLLCISFFCALSARSQSLTPTEQRMQEQGMVNLEEVDSTIRVSLMYSRPDNFCGVVLYTDIHHAFLHPQAARALALAQQYLHEERPDLDLIVFDACRPMSVQQQMWDRVKNTPQQNYVSNPRNGGGLHNYGLAVDISLCDSKGDTLDMGVKVDNMDSRSHIDREAELVSTGRISAQARQNRELLRRIMKRAGFMPLRTEWWHFNLVSRDTARRYYRYIR